MTDTCPTQNSSYALHWPERMNDAALDQLSTQGWCVLHDALPSALYDALSIESQTPAGYQAARLAHGTQANSIRSDRTRWLEPSDPAGQHYLTALDDLGTWLNQQLYLGIKRVEAHYACYEQGQYYAQHRDNPVGCNDRALSCVLYLNAEWHSAWGGALRLQDRQGAWQVIWPHNNHWVLFDSNLCHEVQPATHTRRSIAGWLRRDLP